MTPPKMFDTRIQRKFLWRPKTINGDRRWFSFEIWEEEYTWDLSVSMDPDWYPTRWIFSKGKGK